jgi:hypothetical protein
MNKLTCIAMKQDIRAKMNPNPKQEIMQVLTMRVLIGNIGHGRRLLTKGNSNALHDLEGIIDRVENT